MASAITISSTRLGSRIGRGKLASVKLTTVRDDPPTSDALIAMVP